MRVDVFIVIKCFPLRKGENIEFDCLGAES
jgi:hypothetical protein